MSDIKSISETKKLYYYINGDGKTSRTDRYFPIFNPSEGNVIAEAPACRPDEIDEAVAGAHRAYAQWAATPVTKRVQILYRFRELIDAHLDELVLSVATEHGKVLEEARGDVLKAREVVEVACGMPSLLKGECLADTSAGYDTVLVREPLGVFVGIAPFNFPAMIPMGWMVPLCIASGNCMVLKPANATPMTAMRMLELLYEAGLPAGVVNLVTCENEDAERLIKHPDVKGVTFVGTTRVGGHVYATAAAHGKRVQALCQAKNHALVLEDAPVQRTASGIINSAYGCAGERCMALPVVVAQEDIADELVESIKTLTLQRKIGPAYEASSDLGPLVTSEHRGRVVDWIAKGIEEGAECVLDGRDVTVPGHEKGFYLGPTILDHVTPEMRVGQEEIFGPVLCIKRVKDFNEGLDLMNSNPFANGAIIYTQNGYYGREFARQSHAGMVGINVGIPVPISVFPFSGHKQSFFGDLHVMGTDGVRFFTETKCITSHWFDELEMKQKKIDTWDGTMG